MGPCYNLAKLSVTDLQQAIKNKCAKKSQICQKRWEMFPMGDAHLESPYEICFKFAALTSLVNSTNFFGSKSKLQANCKIRRTSTNEIKLLLI